MASLNDDPSTLTPYSTVSPLFQEDVANVPEWDRERLAAYDIYERIYWSVPRTFKIAMRGTNDQPIYIPSARTIVNETNHYLLKGLTVGTRRNAETGGEQESPLDVAIKSFIDRERFYSKFSTAKLSGVARGDWILHLTADPEKPEGQRISVNSVDPAAYFPEYDDDDNDRIIAVNLAETIIDPEDGKPYVKVLRYEYDDELAPAETRRVVRQEAILELDGWWNGKAQKVKQRLLPPELLEEGVSTIPVYHFKNIDWQGDPFGRSELAGFEMLLGSINQTISDEELALALMGLGVYATDAPTPTDDDGTELPWVLAPASVLEHPTGTSFKKVEGINTVTPMQDHLAFLVDSLHEGSATFRTNAVDVQLAESGVALAIKFSPTAAKLETRDLDGTSKLAQFWYDWKFWWKAYENQDFTTEEILIALGDKLPTDRVAVLNELNNMLDRMVIDRVYYREQVKLRLGYDIPDNMGERVKKEQEELAAARMFESPENGDRPNPSTANNSGRPNESAGTEAQQQ